MNISMPISRMNSSSGVSHGLNESVVDKNSSPARATATVPSERFAQDGGGASAQTAPMELSTADLEGFLLASRPASVTAVTNQLDSSQSSLELSESLHPSLLTSATTSTNLFEISQSSFELSESSLAVDLLDDEHDITMEMNYNRWKSEQASSMGLPATILRPFSSAELANSLTMPVSHEEQAKKLITWRDTAAGTRSPPPPPPSNAINHDLITRQLDRINLSDRRTHNHNDILPESSFPQADNNNYNKTNDKNQPIKKDIQLQMEQLEYKIFKAARMELNFLNQVKDIGSKRHRLIDACDSLQANLLQQQQQEQASADGDDQQNTTASLTPEQAQELRDRVELMQAKILKATQIEKIYIKKAKKMHDKRYRWTRLYEHAYEEWQLQTKEAAVSKKLPPLLPPHVLVKSFSLSSESSSDHSDHSRS